MNEIFQQINTQVLITSTFIVVLGIVVVITLVKAFRVVVPPNEVLIFSGRKQKLPDGSTRDFWQTIGGSSWRVPIWWQMNRMALNAMEVPISIRGAYSQGGIPLNVEAIANVKISSEPKAVGNAIERFLSQNPNEIRRVAKETLEGHLRGVLARLTPEEVNEDRLRFSEELVTESEMDLRKLGIHLDTLKILHVSDDKRYLDSIGREMIANVIKGAEIAESDAQRQAELAEAGAQARANVVKSQTDASIARLKNELRKIQAELDGQVRAEEERSLAAAREARALAEQELQQLRAQVEAVRLRVDQVMPAEAQQEAQQHRARGDAAIHRERGLASSQALAMMNEAWSEAGENALSMYIIQDLEKILASAAKGVGKVNVESLNLIDSGQGNLLPAYVASYPAMLAAVLDSVASTTGIDVRKALSSGSAATTTSATTNGEA